MNKTRHSLALSLISLLLCFSMLLGTTWAWFTDSVTSTNNRIQTGTLDVELEYYIDGDWKKVTETTNVFEEDALWEPGHTEVVYLKISNLGSLALKYDFSINVVKETIGTNAAGEKFLLSDHIRYGVDHGKTPEYAGREEAVDAVSASSTPLKTAYSKKASMKSGDPEAYVALVVYMPESVGNEANAMKGTEAPVINLGISVMATQYTVEDDSFGKDYDEGAFFPDSDVDVSVTAPVNTDADNKVTEAVELGSSDNVSAVVSKDTLLESGTDFLTLSVTELETTNGNITVDDGEETRSVDVHVDGIADGNTVPVIVSVKKLMPAGLNMGNYTLYHVENGTPVAMTYVTATPVNHNEFTYDPATGDVVIAFSSFSELAVVAETAAAWEGNYNYDWYGERDKAEYIIANADQLAGFGAIVGGMAEGIEIDAFAGSTVKLVADVNLGDDEENNVANKIFYPIGYHNSNKSYDKVSGGNVSSSVSPFEGTFDGNGHKISNFYQNTWEMFGDYNSGYSGTPNHYDDAMGLFGYVLNGTVKNLTVDNFSSDGEFTPTGVIAAYACKSTFENIAITNCNPRVYNTGNGGIVGIGGNSDDPDTYELNFNNITIDNTNKITALWGSWDVACGGLVGMFRGAGHVYMNKCHVAAQIDAYNDVCGNYQYYWYRYSGMLIGTNKNMTTDDNTGYTVPETGKFHAENCTVHFDKWNDYYYCELVANSLASYTHDHQFSRLELVDSVDADNMKYTTLDGVEKDISTSGRVNFVTLVGGWETENATCYHFVDGNVWNHEDAGKETVNGVEVLKEDKQHVYLPFNQLFTGYGWGVKHIPVGEFGGVDILDREVAESLTKFSAKYADNTYRIGDGCSVEIGELFEALEGADINVSGVWVSAEAVDGNTVVSELEVNKKDWRKSLLTINGTGTVKLTVQDYDYCVPTTLIIKVESIVLGSDDENTKIVGLSANRAYEYAPVTVLDTWDWQDVPAGSTEIDVDAGLWAVRIDGTTDCEYILVGQTNMDGSLKLNTTTSKLEANVTSSKGWSIDKWGSDYSEVKLLGSPYTTNTQAALQVFYTIPSETEALYNDAYNRFNYKFANPSSDIIPIEKLKTVKFQINTNSPDRFSVIWKDVDQANYRGTVRIYVTDSDVCYYEIPFTWGKLENKKSLVQTINCQTSLAAKYTNPHGYVTGISVLPWGGTPEGWELNTSVSYNGAFLLYLHSISTSAAPAAPELYLVGDAYDGKYEITGFDEALSYTVSTDLINYKSIGSGFTSYKVSDTGTYYFKAKDPKTNLESLVSSVVIEGERETVQGLVVGENNIVDLGADTVYEWAKYTHVGYGEWTRVEADDERVLTLTDGLTAIRLPAQENKVAGKPQFLYVKGTNVGTIGLKRNMHSPTPVLGTWTGSGWQDSDKYDLDSARMYSFSFLSSFYSSFEASKKIFMNYSLTEDEIIQVKNAGSITFRIAPNPKLPVDKGIIKGKVRLHIAGGLKEYYDIYFNTPTTPGNVPINIGSSVPANESGYLTAITIWPIYEAASNVNITGSYSVPLRFVGIYQVDNWIPSNTTADNTDESRCRIRISK